MRKNANQNNMTMCNMMMCGCGFMMMNKTIVSFDASYPRKAN